MAGPVGQVVGREWTSATTSTRWVDAMGGEGWQIEAAQCAEAWTGAAAHLAPWFLSFVQTSHVIVFAFVLFRVSKFKRVVR